jgi:hypothetical protein
MIFLKPILAVVVTPGTAMASVAFGAHTLDARPNQKVPHTTEL